MVKKCNSNQKWNKYKCRCQCKNPKKQRVCENDYVCNPATYSCDKYVGSTIDDSVVICV